ncbi:hypothetical protein MBM_03885 [Drepanopeziza brunnea f. sp. 'multigermtubi' MB_m1]|uniref:Uncharacterized protein n=1 Tax=Marssonina brunnea f. sp. multigermtubi (strain MB_m1) TaxID=1072389 RepID=K1XBL3_MARBU|nr:uncharacterized protein MBM_03885 [Drepanopeziza brunnea f. sp. 'multigermtubi' MB_m1]EKD18113.1 hypothetical protein MBM_03885 [Drepanopeziza brunnea f. sp. 'multigermtubi' MB_m1]
MVQAEVLPPEGRFTSLRVYGLSMDPQNAQYNTELFSVEMVVPPLRKAGVYYLWPGLQDIDYSGVFQEVLDGKSGTWWIGSGWCCSNPSLPWGSGFDVRTAERLTISKTRDTDSENWSSSISSGSKSAKNSFPLAYKNFNQAVLAIELHGVDWDFGPLVWINVVMVMNTTETAWCTNPPENYDSTTRYTMVDPKATTSGGLTTCTIDRVEMQGPA